MQFHIVQVLHMPLKGGARIPSPIRIPLTENPHSTVV